MSTKLSRKAALDEEFCRIDERAAHAMQDAVLGMPTVALARDEIAMMKRAIAALEDVVEKDFKS